jgi:hypothetical protein
LFFDHVRVGALQETSRAGGEIFVSTHLIRIVRMRL